MIWLYGLMKLIKYSGRKKEVYDKNAENRKVTGKLTKIEQVL